jgi:hypothetical protein
MESNKMIKIEHNVQTGEIKEIELTAKELREKADLEAAIQAKEAEEAARAAAKDALLARLGMTAEEAALLLS